MTKSFIISALFLGLNCAVREPCSGEYYAATNNLFVDCFDASGTLISQQEKFFEYSLDKFCSDVTFADIAQDAVGWIIPTNVTDSSELLCCDYYQRTVGYVFTECN